MPVRDERGARVELAKAARRKARKVVAQQRAGYSAWGGVGAEPPIGPGGACY
jgi:hypothetical protein